MTLDLERPLRNPDRASSPLMTKRARWLVVVGFLLPGSAQVLAGNRRLGRFGLGMTILLLVLGALSLAGFFFARTFTLTVFTNSYVLLGVQILLVAYAVIWLILGFDTLRITNLVRVSPNWRVVVAILAVILTVVPSAGAVYAANLVGAGRGAISDIFAGAPSVEPVDGRYNILLLGTDAGEDREGLRPDSLSLVSVDAETGQSVIIGLPRELHAPPFPEDSPMYAKHPNGFGTDNGCNVGRCWLNGLYAEVEYYMPELYPDAVSRGSEPGIEATKDAVTGVTGLEVQFYVLLDMDGFSGLIDALGGVDMDVKERLPIGGNIDPYSGELVGVEGWIEPGQQNLDGWHALWYARSRYGSAMGDYDRMERQRELQGAILAQMNPANVLTRFQQVADAGKNLVETDIPESMLGRFVDLAAKAREYPPVPVELTPPNVDPEFPDWTQIRDLVQEGVAEASPPEVEEE
ncbi:MAG: LCP family protein [Leucobacter sp.]